MSYLIFPLTIKNWWWKNTIFAFHRLKTINLEKSKETTQLLSNNLFITPWNTRLEYQLIIISNCHNIKIVLLYFSFIKVNLQILIYNNVTVCEDLLWVYYSPLILYTFLKEFLYSNFIQILKTISSCKHISQKKMVLIEFC